MTKRILTICFLLITVIASSQSYDVLNYSYNGTPTYGIKIKTNIPYTNGSQMPTVRIEGYNYGFARTIGVNLVWYIYEGNIVQYSASSFGGYTFPIKLSRENDKIIIFIDDRNYYNRFKVSVYANGMGEPASWFTGWTTADETVSGTNTVDVPYTNVFGGNVGIGTANPATKLHVRGNIINGIANIGTANNTSALLVSNQDPNYGTLFGTIGSGDGWIQQQRVDGGATAYNLLLQPNGGNVAIGTTNMWSPSKFLVEGTLATKPSGVNGYYSYLKSNWSENNAFELGIADGTNFNKLVTSSNYHFGSTLQFWTTNTERIRIDGNGNVGIGTTTPSAKLDIVSGNSDGIKFKFSPTYGNTSIGLGYDSGSDPGNFMTFKINNATGSAIERVRIMGNGNVGIGTTNPGDYRLAVEGTIGARKLKVTQQNWADDVFKKNYKLRPISEVEKYIQQHGHLPEVPSEKEVKGKDLDISETQTMLLKKIEELTLYIIAQEKRIKALEQNQKNKPKN